MWEGSQDQDLGGKGRTGLRCGAEEEARLSGSCNEASADPTGHPEDPPSLAPH